MTGARSESERDPELTQRCKADAKAQREGERKNQLQILPLFPSRLCVCLATLRKIPVFPAVSGISQPHGMTLKRVPLRADQARGSATPPPILSATSSTPPRSRVSAAIRSANPS